MDFFFFQILFKCIALFNGEKNLGKKGKERNKKKDTEKHNHDFFKFSNNFPCKTSFIARVLLRMEKLNFKIHLTN